MTTISDWTDRLLLFGGLSRDGILPSLARVSAELAQPHPKRLWQAKAQARRLIELAEAEGLCGDLWQLYLARLILTEENAWSLSAERGGESSTVDRLAQADFEALYGLFHYDFADDPALLDAIGPDTLALLRDYAPAQPGGSSAARIGALADELARAADAPAFQAAARAFVARSGAGIYGLHRAFRVAEGPGGPSLTPVAEDPVTLDSLVGYERQKAALLANTSAFVAGRPCNHMLLYGDAGTGKSTSVRALLTRFGDSGLRLVELYKHQMHLLTPVIAALRTRAQRFIILIDDLSFEEDEVGYKYLKAVIEGGAERRPANILLCATSNRRHLVRETWSDRDDMEHDGDIHRSDTMQEKLSLAGRFGCLISFARPDRALWREMILTLADRAPGLSLSEDALLAAASRYELRHGGVSGRTASQFINEIAGGDAGT